MTFLIYGKEWLALQTLLLLATSFFWTLTSYILEISRDMFS